MGISVSGETTRILLVSRSEALRDTVGEALQGQAGDFRLYYVSQPDLAAGRAGDLIPHVILLDVDLGSLDAATLIGQLRQRVPRSGILALVPDGAMQAARAAVLAGARAFVSLPIAREDLVVALRQILTKDGDSFNAPAGGSAPEGKVVVFCAPKGGTGRTTLAVNSAVVLHRERKQPVALVDADYAAPAIDVALNLDPSRNIADLLPKLARLDADLLSSVLATHTSGVRVLMAPPPADLTHPISLPQAQQVLAWLRRMFPWVLVDLGLPMDETAFAFLDSADRIVLSVVPEMVGLRNTRLMLDQLRERGYGEDKTWIVLNRADLRGGVEQADIEARLKVRVRFAIPDDQILATHSINRGVPLALSHPASLVAKSYRKFAAELAGDLDDRDAAREPGGSALGRLFGRSRPATG